MWTMEFDGQALMFAPETVKQAVDQQTFSVTGQMINILVHDKLSHDPCPLLNTPSPPPYFKM